MDTIDNIDDGSRGVDEDHHRDESDLSFRDAADSDGEEDVDLLDVDRSLLRCSDDLDAVGSVIFLRDVPSPPPLSIDQLLLDDDRPQFTPISTTIIEPYNAIPVIYHQPSPSLTAQETYSAPMANNPNSTTTDHVLDSGSNTSTQYIHKNPINSAGSAVNSLEGSLDTVVVDAKGTLSPLSVESMYDYGKNKGSCSSKQLTHQLDAMGLEKVSDDDGLCKCYMSTATLTDNTGTHDHHSSRSAATTAATLTAVDALHRSAVIAFSLLISVIVSVSNMVGSIVASVIALYMNVLMAPWRFILLASSFVLNKLLSLPQWILSR